MFDEFRTATPAEHLDEYSDANIAFHQAIIRLSGSHLMGKTIENLFIHVRAIRRMTISQQRPRRALDHRPHADHRGAGNARHRARRAAGAPALARSRRARREALRLSGLRPSHHAASDDGRPPMNKAVIDTSGLRGAARQRSRPKGRAVDPKALAEVARAPRRRAAPARPPDRAPAPDPGPYGCLSAAHLVALAQEMKLAMTEVYEVATFYHHFDVVKEGETPPPAITVRVCETLSCEMAGARRAARGARERLRERGVRVHRRAVRRPLRAGAGGGRRPQSDRPTRPPRSRRRRRSRQARVEPELAGVHRLRGVPRGGRLRTLDGVRRRQAHGRRRRSPRWRARRCAAWAARAFPSGRKWKIVRAEPAPRLMAVNIDEGEPGHVQGSLLPRARSAPLPRRHADRRVGGRHRRHLHLPARRVRRVPRDARARDRGARSRSAVRACRRSTCGAARARTSAAKSRR